MSQDTPASLIPELQVPRQPYEVKVTLPLHDGQPPPPLLVAALERTVAAQLADSVWYEKRAEFVMTIWACNTVQAHAGVARILEAAIGRDAPFRPVSVLITDKRTSIGASPARTPAPL